MTLILFPLACNDIYCSLILTYYVDYLSDIDECSEAHPLKVKESHPNAYTINTQDSYNCSCSTIFIRNGFECKGTFGFLKTSQLDSFNFKERLFSVMPFFYLGLGLNRLLIHSGHVFKCVMIM